MLAQTAMAPIAVPTPQVPLTPATLNATLDKPSTKAATTATYHPLDGLTAEEISAVSLAVREHGVKHAGFKAIKFVNSAIVLPPKSAVLAYLGIPTAPGATPSEPPSFIERKAETDFIDVVSGFAYNAVLTFTEGVWNVTVVTKLPEGTQPQITMDELLESEDMIRSDPTVIRLAAEVGVKPEELCADGWAIGYDDRFPQAQRLQQCLLYARFSPDSNLYAHPLDFFPILDCNTGKVVHIDFAAHRSPTSGKLSRANTAPTPLSAPDFGLNRERIAPPRERHEYLPELMPSPNVHAKEARDELRPLHVSQPQGVSFKVKGSELEWQKWKMHVSFNGREGLVISTVTYNDDGEVRPIMYRMSLAEMVVPYAAPEHPHPRKFAFDVGEYGMGVMANDLSLGCDCLGTIHYLPGAYVNHNGQPTKLKRAVCIHEEDAGILWKHTDFREGGKSVAVRSRKLVVSMIATVANYEYCFYYNFFQDGTIELETRLTGILNVYTAAPGEKSPYGTLVAPQVQAHYHQHIFSLRLDPMVDGLYNSVIESDLVPLDYPTGSEDNFAGNGFVQNIKTLGHASEGAREYDAVRDRKWTIVNPARKHYASGLPVGYSIALRGAATQLLAKPDSWVARRAVFATKALWVVREDEGNRMFPAGKYVPQTRTTPPDSVGEWTKDDKTLDNEDILLFLTFGTTHVPRPEDWPVMPVEHVRVVLKPNNFFKWSPAIDVRAVVDKASKEVGFNTNGLTTENGNGHSVSEQVASCCN